MDQLDVVEINGCLSKKIIFGLIPTYFYNSFQAGRLKARAHTAHALVVQAREAAHPARWRQFPSDSRGSSNSSSSRDPESMAVGGVRAVTDKY